MYQILFSSYYLLHKKAILKVISTFNIAFFINNLGHTDLTEQFLFYV